jgi:two-component system, chemotaxis family, sensor kinase CheA
VRDFDMNEFLEQFLIESRELVDRATNDLLALEKSPADGEHLDGAFRGFHTLKGGAAIVEFPVMERTMHRVENALDEVRTGTRSVTTSFIGDCLAALNQVLKWLDEIQTTGELPVDAKIAAAAVVARFERREADRSQSAPQERGPANEWAAALLSAHPQTAGRAQSALRYQPGADCFFSNEDPLAVIAALPGLLSLEVEPAEPWPTLEELDPFNCNLVLKALTDQPAQAIATALGDRVAQCEVESLTELATELPTESSTGVRAVAAGSSEVVDAHPLWPQARALLEEQAALLAAFEGRGAAGHIASAGAVAANVLRHIGRAAEADRLNDVTAQSLAASTPDALRLRIMSVLEGASTKAVARQPNQQETGAQTLRVDAARIDALVRLTGELTVATNAIGHIAKLAQDEENKLAPLLKGSHENFEQLVAALQRAALGLRILPLRHVFQRFPRLIREISTDLEKPVNLIIEGEGTEADKAIVENLFEPLLHVLRNAIDHGIEDADTRAGAAKPAVATVRMRAGRQGEHVILDVVDDGRGIDVDRVKQVARERGLVSDEKLDAMSQADIVDLIFAPGFSTAAAVTGLSGRGVGMDAVRTAVRRLGGQVEVSSVSGQGTTVRFVLPFSVMITQVMIVEAGGQLFGVPLDAIVETIRIPKESIVPIGATQAIVLHDQTVPLVQLAEALGIQRTADREAEATVVVAKLNGNIGALQVDRLAHRMDVMLKPLDGLLAGMPGIAGSTLLGDGSVLLVLDLEELIQ